MAAEVARILVMPLDALAVRKVGHPLQPEFAVGAVAAGGSAYVRPDAEVSPDQLRRAVDAAHVACRALDGRLHEGREGLSTSGKTCILADDGLATGATMTVAVNWARGNGAAAVVVAVPVGSPEAVAWLRRIADRVVCLECPASLSAVGDWYRDFGQVSNQRVRALLDASTRLERSREVVIESKDRWLPGDLVVPETAIGVIIFAHGSGSSRYSPRNKHVAARLGDAGLATLLFDLLTPEEAVDRRKVFDIPLLAERLGHAATSIRTQPDVESLPLGFFGASTGAAAALWIAATMEAGPAAVVSRGGRPDLAAAKLAHVRAPTLLIVGGHDHEVLALNRQAAAMMRCEVELAVIPAATHLFEEPGALETVADYAARWFTGHLPQAPIARGR